MRSERIRSVSPFPLARKPTLPERWEHRLWGTRDEFPQTWCQSHELFCLHGEYRFTSVRTLHFTFCPSTYRNHMRSDRPAPQGLKQDQDSVPTTLQRLSSPELHRNHLSLTREFTPRRSASWDSYRSAPAFTVCQTHARQLCRRSSRTEALQKRCLHCCSQRRESGWYVLPVVTPDFCFKHSFLRSEPHTNASFPKKTLFASYTTFLMYTFWMLIDKKKNFPAKFLIDFLKIF